MANPGEPISFYVLEKENGTYYAGYGQWTPKIHLAAYLSEELAQRLQKLYPRTIVSRQMGYDVYPKWSFDQVGEPESTKALEDALKLCLRDDLAKPKIEEICLRVLNANGNDSR